LGDASKEGNVDFANHSLTPLHLIGKEGREKASSDLDIFSLAQIEAQHFLQPIAMPDPQVHEAGRLRAAS
jgi:hypothetical protein